MKYFVFACLFILLLPFSATAKEFTAIGFVEDKKAFDLDENYIRLRLFGLIKGGFHRVIFSKAKMRVEFKKT